MTDPILVEVLRGETVESVHRGAVAVFDGAGKAVLEIGDTERPVFPRSAVKAIQALPLVESGAADAYGFGDIELAMACASHGGEPAHAERSTLMLGKAGLDGTALECGSHWPSHFESTLALARSGAAPTDLHNNCSGKHSGFVCTCRHLGIDHRGYIDAGHRSQEMVREAMQVVTGAVHSPENSGIDGCSIPTYAVPLKSLALGFARMTTGDGLSPTRARAAKRLMAACMGEPFYVAGTGRADTRLMQAAPGRIFVKIGAEGVFCAALPELGLGIALKCADGGERGAEVIVAATLARLLADHDPELADRLAGLARPPVPTRKGVTAGFLRPTAALAG